jgi:predicted porin
MTADTVAGISVEGKQTNWLLGALVPMGQGQVRASLGKAKGSGSVEGASAKQIALGYVYNLSKRTALYGTFSRLTNDGGAAFAVGSPPTSSVNQKSTGYEGGIRHSF